jgi:hypothetical protein
MMVTMTTDAWLVVVTSASVAAAISLIGSFVTIWVGERRERLNRQRETFAQALAAAIDFREFPFIVRRRRADQAAAERARISEELRQLQQQLNYHTAWIEVESVAVAATYRSLITGTRQVVGPMIRDAWAQRPITGDAGVSIQGLDFGALEPLERTYIEAVREHLSWAGAVRRIGRR